MMNKPGCEGQKQIVCNLNNTLKNKPIFWLCLGIFFFGVSCVLFFVSLHEQIPTLFYRTAPILGSLMTIAAFSLSYRLYRSPIQAILTSKEINIVFRNKKKKFPWRIIGWTTVSNSAYFNHQIVDIYDTNGKKIFYLTESFEKYDLILKALNKVTKQQHDLTQRARLAKARKDILPACLFGSIMLFLCAFLINDTLKQQKAARDLVTYGVEAEAEIINKILAPNGITHRLEYQITTPDGLTGTRNAEVLPEYWNSLDSISSVPVIYLPSNPSNSRLITGEPDQIPFMDTPLFKYALSACLLPFVLFFFVGAAFCWYGMELRFDEKNFSFSVRPYGDGEILK